MQVSTISSTSTVASTTSAASTSTSSLSENYQSFLTLMLKQLEVQDPTDPIDTEDYTSQLTQYAALEQQISSGQTLSEISEQLSNLSFATTGVSYLGRTVEAEGDTAPLQDGSANWEYDLDEEAESVTLTVSDEDGNVVYEGTGDGESGTNAFSWDGVGSDGETYSSGAYTLSVTATDADGNALDATLRIKGTVTAADSTSGSSVLELGGVSIAMDDVLAVA